MKTATDIVRSLPRTEVFAAIAFLLAPVAQAAYEVTIPAPNGVGDVVALTNALARANAMGEDAVNRLDARIWLEPGVYNLSGIYMKGKSHLYLLASQGGMIAGQGEKPGDTVLLGGGKAECHRVLRLEGGGNYDWMTVSNLTVTGGWVPSGYDGGGISGNGTTRYSHLVVSNNYAAGSNGGGGGGCMRGRAEHCLFADNRIGGERFGGAFWTDGGDGQLRHFVQGAWHCTFTNNVSPYYGGALHLRGKCIDCKFFGNKSVYGGAVNVSAVKYNWFDGKFTNTTEILDCTFAGNTLSDWGHGSAIYNASTRVVSISNCVFTANDTTTKGGSGVICKGDLYDCIVTNNVRQQETFYDCNLTRCYVADNRSTSNQSTIDYASSVNAYTNVNCIFRDNIQEQYGIISRGKIVVNCTYFGNVTHNGANYGDICRGCRMWNTVLDKNYQEKGKAPYYHCDVRAHNENGDLTLVMTNCVFGRADSYTKLDANGWVTNAGVASTRKVADMRFADAANGDYTPTTRSPLYDAGCQEPWLLSLLGATDLAGNPRVFGKGVDIGAYECQKLKPGTIVIVE